MDIYVIFFIKIFLDLRVPQIHVNKNNTTYKVGNYFFANFYTN